MKKQKQNKERKRDKKSNKRCKVAQRFSHGTVRTKFVNRNKDTVIVDIENFVNLPHTKSFPIPNIQACGHPWILDVYPRAYCGLTNPSGRIVDIALGYDGERIQMNPVIVNVLFRGKTVIESRWKDGYGNRYQVIGNELNKDGTFTFEIDIEIAKHAVSQSVWYPKLNIPNDDIGTKLYRSIEATPDVTFLVRQPKKEIKAEHSSSSSRNDTAIILPKYRNDSTYVTDYVDDMYEHYRYKEKNTTVDRMCMGSTTDKDKTVGDCARKKKQSHINEIRRCVLVDWLVEVHYKFKMFPETLYLTVNLLDRFLSESKESITIRNLQLVGVTALLISSKYEERYIPELQELTYICDGAYTKAKILRMEEKILKTLSYNVTVPTPYTFLVRFLKAASADRCGTVIKKSFKGKTFRGTVTAYDDKEKYYKVVYSDGDTEELTDEEVKKYRDKLYKHSTKVKLMSQIANYVLDGTLLTLEHLTCVWRPSQLAAAAVFIARRAVGDEEGRGRTTPHTHYWNSAMIKYTLYDVNEVVPVARCILNAKKKLDGDKKFLALQKKYSKTKYGKVSHYKFDPIEGKVSMKAKKKKAAPKKKTATKKKATTKKKAASKKY